MMLFNTKILFCQLITLKENNFNSLTQTQIDPKKKDIVLHYKRMLFQIQLLIEHRHPVHSPSSSPGKKLKA